MIVSFRVGPVKLTIGYKAVIAEAGISGRTVSSTACTACTACIACMAAESIAPKRIALTAAGLPACTAAGRAAGHAAVLQTATCTACKVCAIDAKRVYTAATAGGKGLRQMETASMQARCRFTCRSSMQPGVSACIIAIRPRRPNRQLGVIWQGGMGMPVMEQGFHRPKWCLPLAAAGLLKDGMSGGRALHGTCDMQML